jgi:hypothetical protein
MVALGSAIIAPLLLFGAYAGARIGDTQFDNVQRYLTSYARTLSASVDREIIGEIERLQALAASQTLRHRDFAEFQRQAEASLAMRQGGNIVLVDRNMQELVNTAVPFGKPLPKAAVPEAEREPFLGGCLNARTAHKTSRRGTTSPSQPDIASVSVFEALRPVSPWNK